jgi:hypothetical protein
MSPQTLEKALLAFNHEVKEQTMKWKAPEVYLILRDKLPVTYVGPFQDMEEARVLNQKMNYRGSVMEYQSLLAKKLNASNIISVEEFRNQ